MRTRIATHDRLPLSPGRLTASPWSSEHLGEIERLAAPIGRALFAAIFLFSAPMHFTAAFAGYAAQQGVPAPEILVPIAGLLAGLGGLSILLGYRARIGAFLIVLFLVPVTLFMHRFWTLSDPMQRAMQASNFMKNLAMMGGALFTIRCGSGPFSLDSTVSRRRI